MKRKLLALLLACLMFFSTLVVFSSCVASDDEITVWISWSLLGNNEFTKKQEEWILSTLLNEYEFQNDVEVELTFFEDEEMMIQLITNNGRSNGEVPDIACLFSSENLREMQDIVYPVTNYVSKEEKENILFWETVSDNGKDVGEATNLLGYPIGGIEVTFVAYNKQLFSNAGISSDTFPSSFDELYSLCAQLKNANIRPILSSDNAWNELYLYMFSKIWLQQTTDDTIIDAAKGNGDFTSQVALLESLELSNRFYENEFINHDYATNNDSITQFVNGNGAMFVASNYDLPILKATMGDKLGFFPIPDVSGGRQLYIGGSNQCLSTFNNSKNKEEAIKLMSWLSNKENNLRMVKEFGCFPNRKDISIVELEIPENTIEAKLFPLVEFTHCNPVCMMPMKVYQTFYKYSTLVTIGEMTPIDFAQKMNQTANNYK